MSKRKSKLGNQISKKVVRQNETIIQAITTPDYASPNPFFNDPSYSKNMLLFKQIQQQLYFGSFKISGKDLPHPINNTEIIKRMLYYRGALCMFRNGNEISILPFALRGSLNMYGFPQNIDAIAYADTTSVIRSNLTVGKDCVIINDMLSFGTTYEPVARSIYDLNLNQIKANILSKIELSINLHFKKFLIIEPDANAAKLFAQDFARNLADNSPAIIVRDPIMIDKNYVEAMSTIGSDSTFNELFVTLKNIQALNDILNGIPTSGYGINKGERLVAGEVNKGAEEELFREVRIQNFEFLNSQIKEVLRSDIRFELVEPSTEESNTNEEIQRSDDGRIMAQQPN